jgi:serine/threonine protein kinase
MLITHDWTLKLTDFGEARSTDADGAMTCVGTPIYMAPEIMRGDFYDSKADSYSYGICLVAMIRAEKNIQEFFMQALRKFMRRDATKGVGLAILSNRINNQGAFHPNP